MAIWPMFFRWSFWCRFSPGLGNVRSAMARGAAATVRHRCGDWVHGFFHRGRWPFSADVSASRIQGVTVDLGAILGDQDVAITVEGSDFRGFLWNFTEGLRQFISSNLLILLGKIGVSYENYCIQNPFRRKRVRVAWDWRERDVTQGDVKVEESKGTCWCKAAVEWLVMWMG